MMENNNPVYVKPESQEDLLKWARKWRVSYEEVHNAILNTGCLEAEKLKEYVHRDKWMYHPVENTARILKSGFNLIF